MTVAGYSFVFRLMYSAEMWASKGKKIRSLLYLLVASCALRRSSLLGRRSVYKVQWGIWRCGLQAYTCVQMQCWSFF